VTTFREVFRFELGYRLRQKSTWLYFAAFTAMTWFVLEEFLIGEAIQSGAIHANAPSMIAIGTVLISMMMLAVSAGLFGDAGARDLEMRMHPLVYTSPLAKSGYLGGRYLAALLVNAALLAIVPLGFVLVELRRGGQPELFGPFRVAAYVQPYLVFALPTIVFTGAILFAVSALTGRSMASYAAAAFLFFAAVMSEELVAEQLRQTIVGTLLDPFGFTALSELMEYWTPFEKNAHLIPITGTLLWNRITWFAIAAGVLAVTQLRFRLEEGHRRSSRKVAQALSRTDVPSATVRRYDWTPRFTFGTRLGQTFDIAIRSLLDVFFTRWGLGMLAAMLAFTLIGGWESAGVILETPTWPMTYLVVRDVLADARMLVLLLVVLFTGELVWRERENETAEITDAVALPNWVPLLGKFLALVIALAVVQTMLICAGMLLQAVHGHYDFEPALYVKLLFGIGLTDYLLWGALAVLIHVVVNHKYTGHFLFVVYWVFSTVGRGYLEIDDHLLVYPNAPRWSYSDLSGFEPFLGPWLAFKAYWGAWAVLFLVAANLMWVRGRETRLRERLRVMRQRFTARAALAAGLAATAVLATGGFVFYNTHILNEYRSRDEQADTLADYERLYKRYETLPQPLIRKVALQIELYPERRSAELRGTYSLHNDAKTPIDSVHVLLRREVNERSLAFDRPARLVSKDDVRRYRIYRLERPLEPGGTMALRFHLAFMPRGFSNDGAAAQVVGNGTYFDRSWMPVLGYQPELELENDAARKERGLPPRERLPKLTDKAALRESSQLRDGRWLDLDVVIGTSAEEIALAPGSLRKSWTANGRRYFHYVTDAPIQNNYPILSAAYAVRRERWNGIDVEVFHHPKHTRNLDSILRAMKATVAYHVKHFGPYPHRDLRIVEFPRHAGTYARAFPNTIAFSEGFGFMARAEDGIDYPFLVAAHEVSHQWWGNQLRPARVEGGPVLAETLAHYGAMMVMEQTYGREPLERFRRMLLHKYLVGRQNRRSTEVPLLRSNDQQYIHYDKGALVMYALREYLGEDRVNTALRRMFERYRFCEPPYPTTRDLYAELQAVTSPELQSLLEDLFAEITLWELRAKEPRVERAGAAYRVTFTVDAQKLEADPIGRDRRVPMNDLVEIGVFDGEQTLYLAKHRIRSGAQTITVTVPRKPTRVAVDPYRKLIERELIGAGRNKNSVEVP
jgi:ABC-2 type transport system permease protein